MADTYRLMAGILIFVVFVSVTLGMAAQNFPSLAPPGTSPINAMPSEKNPGPFTASNCTAGNWGCGLANFFVNIGNGLASATSFGAGIFGVFIALLTFQIPALQANVVLKLLNVLIVTPIVFVILLFAFRIGKSIIPTVGGDAD